MYYDYDEEEFYSDSKYQEQVENLEEAIKASVKSEILDEMNRLRTENEKLQGIKDHFDEVKRDYEKKKAECDRAVRNAEHNAKRMRIAELMKDHKVVKWKITWTLVYGQKCDKCDSDRNVEIKLPSGRVVNDSCECKTDSKRYYYPKSYILSEFTDRNGAGRITANYSEEKTDNEKDTYYTLYACTVCDNFTDAKKKKTIETLDDEIFRMLFDEQEECQEVCDRLNASLGDYMYTMDGTGVKEYLKMSNE